MAGELSPTQQRRLTDTHVRLLATFAPLLDEPLIRSLVDNTTARLRALGHAHDLPMVVEAFAGDRLTAAAILQGTFTSSVRRMLIVSPHDAFRSQVTAGWLRQQLADTAAVYTAGLTPARRIHPRAHRTMEGFGVVLTGCFPKPLTDELRVTADVIVTLSSELEAVGNVRVMHLSWDDIDTELSSKGAVLARLQQVERLLNR